jgi:hypothetical protein
MLPGVIQKHAVWYLDGPFPRANDSHLPVYMRSQGEKNSFENGSF